MASFLDAAGAGVDQCPISLTVKKAPTSRTTKSTVKSASLFSITAGFHAGGELKWWDLPATCSAIPSTTIDLSALSALADGTAEMKPIVGCGDVPWSLFGISMAGWNFFISLALAIFSLLAAKRPKDARAPKA
jgi:disulfide bond formation protein DsbB